MARKIIVVGGVEAILKRGLFKQLAKHGNEVVAHYSWDRRPSAPVSIPKGVEAIVVLKSLLDHGQSGGVVEAAKAYGLPVAVVEHKFCHALRGLQAAGLVPKSVTGEEDEDAPPTPDEIRAAARDYIEEGRRKAPQRSFAHEEVLATIAAHLGLKESPVVEYPKSRFLRDLSETLYLSQPSYPTPLAAPRVVSPPAPGPVSPPAPMAPAPAAPTQAPKSAAQQLMDLALFAEQGGQFEARLARLEAVGMGASAALGRIEELAQEVGGARNALSQVRDTQRELRAALERLTSRVEREEGRREEGEHRLEREVARKLEESDKRVAEALERLDQAQESLSGGAEAAVAAVLAKKRVTLAIQLSEVP